MKKARLIGAAIVGFGMTLTAAAYAEDEVRSGYYWATEETKAMQDDDFANPGFIWVESGSEHWTKVEGDAGKACQSCHENAEKSMVGVANKYPKYREDMGKLQNVEQRINECRTKFMKAKAFKWESEPMLALTTYVRHQSKGLPVEVDIDGPARKFYEAGKAFYNERRGQLDMACKHCHQDNAGGILRANVLTQGQSNGFPTYRLKWNKIGSLHRRFRGCNKQVRSKPFAYGADEYVNLELFLNHRGTGLKIETPAVRN